MENSFHYLTMASHAIFQKKLMTELRDSGLTLGQPKVLDYLKTHDGATQKDIAYGCHIEAASLTSILNRMEEKNIIERRMMNGNRRSLHIFMTEKGREYQKAVEKSFLRLETEAFTDISEEERIQFMNTFSKIYQNMTTRSDLSNGKI